MGRYFIVHEQAVDDVRVTADRVRRFSETVEEAPSVTHRRLWRAALEDLRAAIRQARASGCSTEEIQAATGFPEPARFDRGPRDGETTAPAMEAAATPGD